MNWISRAWMWTTAPFRRAAPALDVEPDTRPDEPTVPFGPQPAAYAVGPAFSVQRSMRAFAAFPLVYAAATKCAEDLAALPLVVSTVAVRTSSVDPVVRLFRRPTPRGSGVALRQQMIVDLKLHGTCYVRIVGANRPVSAMSLVRLHPDDCAIEPWPDGQPGMVVYRPSGTGQEIRLNPGTKGGAVEVLVVTLPSWRDGPQAVYGTGAIEVLHETLQVERAAFARARESLEAGRPSMIIRPAAQPGMPSGLGSWRPDIVEQVQEKIRRLFSRGSGGAVVIGESLDMTTPQWTTHDLQALQVGQVAAERILAAMKVPPAKLGLSWPNMAPARDQDRVYWESLGALAQLVDDVLTNWIDSLPGYVGATLHHDLRGVRAAQFAQDGAVARAVQLKAMGVRAKAALRSQGIELEDEDFEDPAGSSDPDPGTKDEPAAVDSERPADQTRPQGPQRSADPMDAPDYEALARLLAGGGT